MGSLPPPTRVGFFKKKSNEFNMSSCFLPSQADLITDLGDQGYVIFGLILFVWELLPTSLLVGFFRVHRPAQDMVSEVEGGGG